MPLFATIAAGTQLVPVARSIFDGLVYAILTGGVFGWLWP